MKTLLVFTQLSFFLSFGLSAKDTVITFVTDGGDWMSASSWDLNRIPDNGDKVIIPAGKTVKVISNMYNSVPSMPLINLKIAGVLQFESTGQLNVQCESTICTIGAGSIPSTGCNCNQITMGTSEAPWKGDYPAVANGNCVLSSCNVSLGIELDSPEKLVPVETTTLNAKIYPNPVIDGTVNLILSETAIDENYNIEMKDLFGNVISVTPVMTNHNVVSFTYPGTLSPGFYLVTITESTHRYTEKVLVQ